MSLSTVQQILLLNFGVLLVHEFEEYEWPGGLPTFMNEVVRKSDRPDRYPLNQLNSLVINVPAAYAFYLIPLFFPHLIWLELRTILFNFLELLLHCSGGFGLARSPYNPGLLTVIPWLALAIWYLVEADITASDWCIAIAYMLGFVIIFLGLVTYVLLASRESPYPFAPEELSRFERYRRFVDAAVHPHPELANPAQTA